MSFLTYMGGDRPPREMPRRVYASVDRVERAAEATPAMSESRFGLDTTVVLDSVESDWFDEVAPELRSLADPARAEEADWRVLVIEARLDDVPNVTRSDAPAWFELELGEPSSGPLVLVYLNLFAPPLEAGLLNIRPLPDRDAELEAKTSMDLVDDASEADIAAVLQTVPPADAAAAYDVGQGNCCALLSSNVPAMYFDLGGGVLANSRSFPPALAAFCFSADPLIVLSHWDWDHWSSANRDPRAYASPWIVPRQAGGLRPVHATFLGRLLRGGRVLVWPTALASIQAGEVLVARCTGSQKSRNDSGLALVVERQIDGAPVRMLFPGDARYDFVPGAQKGDFTALVASHHGGNMGSASCPGCDRRPSSRLVYSYGAGNKYPHPSPAGRALHTGPWTNVRETANRSSAGLGHVHLYWDDTAPQADPPCGGQWCRLTCSQR